MDELNYKDAYLALRWCARWMTSSAIWRFPVRRPTAMQCTPRWCRRSRKRKTARSAENLTEL